MSTIAHDNNDPLLFGADPTPGLVAAEHVEQRGEPDEMALFFRNGDRTQQCRVPFHPFIAADIHAIGECPVEYDATPLKGGAPLNLLASFRTWHDCVKAKTWLAKTTGSTASAPRALYLFLNDPVQQFLMRSGMTFFKGMQFDDLRRMQVDIECYTTPGYDFCNAQREKDRIIAIALSDSTGWLEVLCGTEHDEEALLRRFVTIVRERDPDVIEGHNIFNFDLPYITARAKRCGVKLTLGRDGSVPRRRPSRFSAGERTLAYSRFDVFGRHVIDTLFMVHAYDISHRSLDGFGLKSVAVHFGLAAEDRTYIDGADIAREYDRDPERVMRYVRDDVVETRGISGLLSRSSFAQAQLLPYSYQTVCVRGTATKIDALMLREYLRQEQSLPMPDAARPFAGGYTDMFETGVIENVHHCDVRSLYPSLMLTRGLAPASDRLGIFLKMLDALRAFRLEAKAAMQKARDEEERNTQDALQTTFKILINSFYGYLGFSQGRFNDFDAAEAIAEGGRELLRQMIAWLRKHGARPIEIDTDGIYYVPPGSALDLGLNSDEGAGGHTLSTLSPKSRADPKEEFREAFAASLPEGIEIEFDGEYRSMYSYKMKNYALLSEDGEMLIKGAALKSRGLELFQREFLRELIRYRLEGRESEIPALRSRYEEAINERQWPIEKLSKVENLQDSPETYAAKRAGGKRARSAAYELALSSPREYRAGDQVSYYVTGNKKSVKVYEAAKLTSDWDPENRDENVPYYLGKLAALYKKFAEAPEQGELGL